MTSAQEIINYMESQRNDEQRQILMGFFKTAPGEYGYGDEFLGLKVPQTREVVKLAGQGFPLPEVPSIANKPLARGAPLRLPHPGGEV